MKSRLLGLSLALAVAMASVTGGAGCGQKSGPSELDQAPGSQPAVAKSTGAGSPDAKPKDSPRPAGVPEKSPAARVAGPVREPAAAGGFYPGDANALRKMVAGYLAAAKKVQIPGRVIAIIAPHAGYSFSGPAAGWAYKQIEGADVETVVLVGGHASNMTRAYVWEGSYRSPLGLTFPDQEMVHRLVISKKEFGSEPVADNAGYHRSRDHALEVHVPFLQLVLPRAKIVPVYFNNQNLDIAGRVGQMTAWAVKGRKALIVCSTDLSHYPDAATAVIADRAILQAICTLDSKRIIDTDRELLAKYRGKNLQCTACGLGAVLATVEAAKRLGATGARVIGYDHSGNHMRRDKSRVVGYAAVAIYGPPAVRSAGRMLSERERKMLLSLARKSVGLAFDKKNVPPLAGLPPALKTKAGAFVTLTKGGRLRGCIGTFSRKTEVWKVVVEYARVAAFKDSRFRPLAKAELAQVEFEISVLSPLRKLKDPLDIRLGVDGIWIVGAGGGTGTYLPQVGKRFKTKEQFLSDCTKNKARLPADAWRDPRKATVYAYTAEVFSEGGGKH